ncbi:hypothetical protein CR513_16289, partial [Mucuna pruriens]
MPCPFNYKAEAISGSEAATIYKINQKVARVMKQEDKKSFSNAHICGPFKSFRRRCTRLAKEHRARFYILRRCVTMLVCWQDSDDLENYSSHHN